MVGGSRIWFGGAASRRTIIPIAAASLALAVTAGVALGLSGSPSRRTAAGADTTDRPADKPSYLLPVGTLVTRDHLPKPTLRGDEGHVGVPSTTAPRPTKPVDLAAGNTAAQYSGATGTLTPAGIATLAMQRGCRADQAVIATAVAMAESGGSPSAQGDVSLMDSTWDWSAGLWQVRGLKAQRNTGQLRDSVANQNAVNNSAAMYAISSGCTSWSPWTTYNTGAYRAYLDVATQAVRYVLRYYAVHHAYPAVAPPDPDATVPVPGNGGGDGLAVANGPGTASASSATRPSASRSTTKPPAAASRSSAADDSGSAARGHEGGASSSNAASRSSSSPSSSKKSLPSLPAPSKAVGAVTSTVKSLVPKLPLPTTTHPKVPKVTLPSLPVR